MSSSAGSMGSSIISTIAPSFLLAAMLRCDVGECAYYYRLKWRPAIVESGLSCLEVSYSCFIESISSIEEELACVNDSHVAHSIYASREQVKFKGSL